MEKIKTDKILIDKERYKELSDLEDKWLAFEAAGVDNWSGYDVAMSIYREEKED